MKIYLLFAFLTFLSLEFYSTNAASACSSYTSTTCDNDRFCAYNSTSLRCKCNNTMSADIIFVLDRISFSASDWIYIKAFVNHTIEYGSPKTNRYGIITYNSTAKTVLSLNSNIGGDGVTTHVNNMNWQSTATCTISDPSSCNLGSAISAALTQFSSYSSSSRKKVLISVVGQEVTGSPCQYNVRDYDVFSYVITLGSFNHKNVKCLAISDNNYEGYISTVSSASSLSTIYQTIELDTCPHQPDIRVTEVQPLNTTGPRFVEFYNFGEALQLANLSFSGLFKGYASSLTVSQGEYFVIYDSDDQSYPNCSSCSCSKVAGTGTTIWCSSALYIGCGVAAGQSYETIKSSCSAQKAYSTLTGWQITVSWGTTKLDNVTCKSDSYWPTITSGYPYEKRKKLYNPKFGSSWAQACKIGGTPGQDVLQKSNCTFNCTKTMCNLSGGGSSGCSSGSCSCSSGYYSYNYTCNPLPPPSNCTGTYYSSKDIYEFDLARWDGTHYYSAYYCSVGSPTCTSYQHKTTYGPPVSVTETTGTSTIQTQVGTFNVYYSPSTTCTLSTLSPTSSPTSSPTHSVPVIGSCNVTLAGSKTSYTVHWVKPTYGSGAPNTSSLTGYAIYEDGAVTTTTGANTLNFTGTWQHSSKFTVGSDYVSVSGVWDVTDITTSREQAAATKCTTYTAQPTAVPTHIPTSSPTRIPSRAPSGQPTKPPTYANVSIARCTVTYTASTTITVNWTLPTFTSSTITSSQAYYYLTWTSNKTTHSTFYQGSPPQTHVFQTNAPDNTTGKMYMYVYWDVSGVSGQGPKTRCTIYTPAPTRTPTGLPTSHPSRIPTGLPTSMPSRLPTAVPTPCPTYAQASLAYCVVTVSAHNTQGNFTFPLVTISSAPDPSDIQYEFTGSSFSSVFVTQNNVLKTSDGVHGYETVVLKNFDINNTSSTFKMYLSYINLGCSQDFTSSAVTCTVQTAAPSKSPTDAPTSQPTLSPTYGAVGVNFARNNLEYCTHLACNYTSQTPIQLVNEGANYNFYVQRSYGADYTYNITVYYNFSFVNLTMADDLNFTDELTPYLRSLNASVANISKIVDVQIPNNSYWSNDLHLVNTWVGPTYNDLSPWSGNFILDHTQQVGYLSIDIIKEDYASTVRDYDGEVFLLTLTGCAVDATPHENGDNTTCYIMYPNQLIVIIKDENNYVTTVNKTTANKSYQSWFWYVIAGIALLLAVIGYFVYKWWVNKKMAEAQVTDVQGDIDAVISEQEKGFGNDLGKDNVNFNPLAQPLSHLQKPANNDWTTNTKPNNGEFQEKAEVRVEKFNVKQEFGPQTVARRGDRM